MVSLFFQGARPNTAGKAREHGWENCKSSSEIAKNSGTVAFLYINYTSCTYDRET